MQASVNPLNFFTNCYLSDQPIDNDYAYYYNGEVYDSRFVDTSNSKAPTLKPDVVTLDDTDTKGADTDIDKEDDEEEFPEWIEEDDEEWEVEEEEVQPDFTITARTNPGTGIFQQVNGNVIYTNQDIRTQSIMQMIEDLAIDNSRPEQNLF
jgi:hypothetical protein